MATPSWDQIRLFLAVLRARSLAGAAARLGVDASTVSRRLARLEEELGGLLFDRTRDGLLPTPAAEALLPAAEEVERGVARFEAAGAQVETAVEGVVRLAVPPAVADHFVAPLLPALVARHPGLVLELDARVSYADLTRREADLALRAVRPSSGELLVTRAIGYREVPLAAPAYARALGRLRRLEEARWVSWGDQLAHLPAARWLRSFAPSVTPVLRSDHVGSVVAAVAAGLGVAVLAEPFVTRGLVPVAHARPLAPAWAALPSSELWLVTHRVLRQVPRVAAVWEFLLAEVGALAARPRS